MDNELTYDLFSELNMSLSDSTIKSIQGIIDNSNNWEWAKTNLPNIYLKNDELLSMDIGAPFNDFIKDWSSTLTILKVPPNCFVPWHIDVKLNRRCVINTPITLYPNSYTLVTNAPTSDQELLKTLEYNTFKMPYLLDKMYLLNSQKYHSVFNFDDSDRYVISFCSEMLNYQEACKYFKDKNLINKQW